MKTIYTEAARQALVDFQKRQQQFLEELIAERKYVYGDDVVEVTASDIKDAGELVRPVRPSIRRYKSMLLVAKLYSVIGVVIATAAIAYPYLNRLISFESTQGLFFLVGIGTAGLGVALSWYIRARTNGDAYSQHATELRVIREVDRFMEDSKKSPTSRL